jgi:hypothetical protein
VRHLRKRPPSPSGGRRSDALGKADRLHVHVVRRHGVRLLDDLEAKLGRVEGQASAILSSWTSCPNAGCGVPCPRFGPHGGLFVNIRQLEA